MHPIRSDACNLGGPDCGFHDAETDVPTVKLKQAVRFIVAVGVGGSNFCTDNITAQESDPGRPKSDASDTP